MRAIAIADAEMQSRIAAVFEHLGLPAPDQLSAFGDVAGLELDASTVVILACDVDAPRDIAHLRRLCRQMQPAATVVISPPLRAAGLRRALDAGADALVFDSELELTLAPTVQAVVSGQSVVPRRLRAGVERPALSHRELQVLSLVRQGLTNAEIAKHLFLAESTIKSHLSSAFAKFGVHSRTEAATALAELERGVA